MTRVHHGIVRQAQQDLVDAPQQLLAVATGQVGPPDRSREQGVAHEGDTVPDEGDTPRTVTRDALHVERQAADGEPVAIGQPMIWRGRGRRPNAQPGALLRRGVVERAVGGMQVDRHPRLGDDALHSQDMIEMGVGEPDGSQGQALGIDPAEKEVGCFTGIDDDRVPGAGVRQDVAVLGEGAVGETDDLNPVPPGAPSGTFRPPWRRWSRHPPPW